MARIGAEKGLPEKALDSAAKLLDSPFGMVLNYPAYTTYHIELGEQSTYPAGYKENGGIFCHNNPWVIIAQTEAGRGNDAWELYRKISPAWIEDQSLHRVEPYVYCQMVAGKEAARPGEGKNSWLTPSHSIYSAYGLHTKVLLSTHVSLPTSRNIPSPANGATLNMSSPSETRTASSAPNTRQYFPMSRENTRWR